MVLFFLTNHADDTQYFRRLGKEIVVALEWAGYKRCDGNVMSSCSRWCKPFYEWQVQIENWIADDTWEHLRHALIFFDARAIVGKGSLIRKLKGELISLIRKKPERLVRLSENTERIPREIGFFGQLLGERNRFNQRVVDLKQSVYFPFVNGLRLLALKEQIYDSSTLERFQQLPTSYQNIIQFQQVYEDFLIARLKWQIEAGSYDDAHFIRLNRLSKIEKKKSSSIGFMQGNSFTVRLNG